MKTNYLSGRNLSIYTVFGLVGLLASSCGSYQNSSYYDNDGVYGSSERPRTQTENRYSEENLEQGNKYKDYFAANKDNYSDGNETFTDVENYNSQSNDTVARNQQDNYAGWGDNNKNVTINYYNNDYWGWNSPYYGWGWNSWYSPRWNWGWNSWYGSYWNVGFGWGWNSPYYGWGWNSWYSPYYNGYYGHHHHHYIGGTRDGYSYYGNRGRSYNRPGVYSGGRGNTINNSPRPRSSNFSNPRSPNFSNPRNNSGTINPRNNNVNPRSNEVNPRGNEVNPRNNNVNPRSNEVNPRGTQYQDPTPRPRVNPSSEPRPRSSEYSAPRSNNNYSTPRSSNSGYSSPRSSGSSYGGGGNSGGGRSGGGGGRR